MAFVIFCMAAPPLYFLYKYIVQKDDEKLKKNLEEIKKYEDDHKEAS